MKPHLIMPMGGAGSRFYKNGYMQPKPLIKIHGKPFLYWSTMSIKRYVDIEDLTFVVLQQHIDEFHIDEVIYTYFPDAKIKLIPEVLPGPVFTALHGVEDIYDNAPVIFNDCDHMFKCDVVNKLLNDMESVKRDVDGERHQRFEKPNVLTRNFSDGILLTFTSNTPQFSYVKYGDDHSKITGTVEKQVVSNHAICGAYIFKSADAFRSNAKYYIEHCPYSECFMSGVYNVMCDNGMVIKDYLLDYHVEFGTPEEYEKAKDSEHFY